MTLKRTAAEKRARLPLKSDYTKSFEKDWTRYNGAGRADMSRLKKVMGLLIANDGPLGAEWSDHELTGKEWQGHRELHVGGDLLLIYKLRTGGIVFVAIGTHSELFGR